MKARLLELHGWKIQRLCFAFANVHHERDGIVLPTISPQCQECKKVLMCLVPASITCLLAGWSQPAFSSP